VKAKSLRDDMPATEVTRQQLPEAVRQDLADSARANKLLAKLHRNDRQIAADRLAKLKAQLASKKESS
jgi:hypothetical protein